MAEEIVLEVSGFTNLRAQLREANQEVQMLTQQFGSTSAQVQSAAQRAAELKDQIDDARDSVSAFTGAGQFQAVGKAISGVAGGFAAIQGAMGLVGAESKDLQKTLVRVQSALALSQGLAQLEDLGRAFGQLKNVAVNAFNSIKAAIGSTGIGLLLVALGTAVAYWDEIAAGIGLSEKSTEELEAAQKKYNGQLEFTNFLVNEYTRDYENATKIAIAQAQARGASAEELANIEIAGREKIIKLLKQENADAYANFKATVKGLKETDEAYIKAGDSYRAVARKNDATIDNINTQNKVDAINAQKTITDDFKRKSNERIAKQKQEADAAKKATLESYDRQTKIYQQIALLDKNLTEEQRDRLKMEFDQLNERGEMITKIVAIEEKASKEKRELTKEEVKEKKALNAELDVVLLRQDAETAKFEFDIQKKKNEDLKKQAEEYAQILTDREERKYARTQNIIDDHFKYEEIALLESNLTKEELGKALEQNELKRLEVQLKAAEKAGQDTTEIELQIARKKKEIRDKDSEDEKANRQETVDYLLNSAVQFTSALQQLSNARMSQELAAAKGNKEEEEKIKKEYFEKDKAYQYAKAIISGIQAGIAAFAQGMTLGGPPLAAIFLGISAATTAIQLAAIEATDYVSTASSTSGGSGSTKSTPSTYEQGGLLMGRSHDLGGIRTSLGELEGGEFVMNRRATANFLPLLESINSLGNTRGPEVSVAAQAPIVKTYVVATDMTSQQEANARLNALARL
jgi:hypothetical protein